MPAEWLPHARTIMAWPGCASHSYWPLGNHEQLNSDVTRIAQAIARFEKVTIYVARAQADEARVMLQNCSEKQAAAIEMRVVGDDDVKPWMRDIAPTFVVSRESKAIHGIDFHFNGWGAKDHSESNRTIARHILHDLQIPEFSTSLVAEGGAIETDGEGTLLATESALVNPNRNPDMDRDAVEDELKRVLGISKVIWLPGVAGADTTDCHIDALARFAGPGVIVLSRPPPTRGEVWTTVYKDVRRILTNARDAKGRSLQIVNAAEPDISRIQGADAEMIPSYVNYLHVKGAVIVPQFGVPETDVGALGVLGDLFSDKEIVPVYLYGLPNAGGGLHCITQQVPLVELDT
ncbi:agmatine deiminase family protein [Aspergillus glaucus CBS 516.65]|uniref:Agmatine deiminase n=1 Tax=Aspergillus glaucus CBS 516.65 TaxID=1160497 RepID=A0A1L9VAE1_ASPGL|nr:hypothetical protein ASPGLDRAFT_133806 [Aspergillus glaucus CBS 516.65]OJJ80870.1 hypothetical protein ASPGLDRAFT_133806 [Aspergillus glaucus CBS 516.65]